MHIWTFKAEGFASIIFAVVTLMAWGSSGQCTVNSVEFRSKTRRHLPSTIRLSTLNICQNEPISQKSGDTRKCTDFDVECGHRTDERCLRAAAARAGSLSQPRQGGRSHRAMLPRPLRLTKKKDFTRLALKGRSVFGPYATLRIVEVRPKETGKVAFITSTKILKRAVDRNRAKRRFREAVRSLLAEIPQGVNLLFVLKPEARDADYQKLVAEVRRLVSKIPEALLQPSRPSSRGKKHQTKLVLPKVRST